jgi:predicted metal-dependent hydrolase
MFVDADPVITRALARYIADNDADASRILGDFIDANSDHVRGRARRTPTQLIFTAGEHHDLRDLFDELNARYFENRIDAAITWGPRSGRPRRRNSIKMGSYSVEDRLIRIHRSLDRAFVPRFFVAWIVFHEMLHQIHDIRVKNGRREFHSKEFLAAEASFELYDQAKLWERRHLDALLTY